MTDRRRTVVVPFRTPERGRTPRRSGAEGDRRTWVARFWELVDSGFDENAEWDLLITRTVQAWCWRDPGSVRAVEECLARLKASVERDWS
jgi:hypothetical protein